ncbi:hypothetical protein BTH38_04665 [Bacillus toyonensis]|uniref:HEPN domain-containing protein n=1 Tax=Bacillus toyonensis TaxID=155322 RepID=UPI000A19F07C|nr:HEPN domain-containing protein [Bacillus toyonensis]OSM14693.1 hypothetical protein BTH38_04665 [Bacillus toyonensis]
MKPVRQVVEITYKDEKFIGYLNFDETEKYLEFLVEPLKNQDELLNWDSLKTFNCTLYAGKVISCLKCKLVNTENDNLVRYTINIYAEDNFKRYDELKFNNITAIFPKVNVWFVGKEFKYNSSLEYKGQQIDLSVYEGKSRKLSRHTELTEKYLIVQLESTTEMDLELVNEIYFKISALFSFFIDKYVSYTHYVVGREGGLPYEIYQRGENPINDVKLNEINYRLNKKMTDEEFFDIFVKPLTLPNFDIWFNYVGILRSKQLIEEQYLIYARCLEIISRDNVDTKIYKDVERRAKSKIYKELIESMDLDQNYKESLIEAFKFSNTKNFKVLLLQLIQNSSFKGQLEMLAKEVKLDKLVGNIVNMRNHLTHGTPFEKIDTESLVFYEGLIKQIVTYFILQEHGINAPLKIEHLYNNFEKLPDSLIK